MSLHNLVSFRLALTQALDLAAVRSELQTLLNNVTGVKHSHPDVGHDHVQYLDRLIDQLHQMQQACDVPVAELADRLGQVNNQINHTVHELFFNNYELEERKGTVDSVRAHRRLVMSADVEHVVKQRILLYTSWRYPALEIGCRDGEWTQFMIAADPLYIMDCFPEFLDSTKIRFSAEYQRRLRPYTLINHDLGQMPDSQFGFVFSWGYFNYVSLDTMRLYLQQVFHKLKPGGIFMFSFNDGDTPAGAGMAEKFAQSYMPKSLLVSLSQSLGYELVADQHCDGNITWLELRRPGELTTSKAHQALGEIMNK